MLRYVANRLIWSAPVLIVATLLTFLLVHSLPGDPFLRGPQYLGHPEMLQNMKHKFGVDKPLWQQYLLYMNRAFLHGDFGPSFVQLNRTVGERISSTFPTTFTLATLAMLISMTIGTVVGVLSALRHNRMTDYVLMIMSTAVFAFPTFVAGTYWLVFLPQHSGWDTPSKRIGPILILALAIMPYFSRLVRGAMLESLGSEYVMTARAKGLRWRTTVVRHVLRNSLIPMVTNAGPVFGFLLSGSFIIEYIFNVPGIASEFTRSVIEKDYNLVLGTTVLLAVIFITLNLIVDIVLTLLDPRITHD